MKNQNKIPKEYVEIIIEILEQTILNKGSPNEES
jgi:hypothetical protein